MAYLLFEGSLYYPKGGAEDMRGEFDDLSSAMSVFDSEKYDWPFANILCLDKLKIVMSFYNGEWHNK